MLIRVQHRALRRLPCVGSRSFQSKTPIDITPEVQDALHRGSPVVALESTIITHGMPHPINLNTALSVQSKVRAGGSIPATIGVINGRIVVGLQKSELEMLANEKDFGPLKLSRHDLAAAVTLKKSGGTTIAATSLIASRVGIRVFASGGLGGVHRGGELSWDVSTDLTELGRTPIALVSAGIKSILDIGRTLEYLETQGVTVVTYGPTLDFPGFYSPISGHQTTWRVDSPKTAAEIINAGRELGLNGILFAAPIPEEHAGAAGIIQHAVDKAVRESEENGMSKRGKEATPWILRRVAELTQGKSIPSNVALIENTAYIGGRIAAEYAKLQHGQVKRSDMPDLFARSTLTGLSHEDGVIPVPASPSTLAPATLLVVGAAAIDVTSQPVLSSHVAHSTSPGKVTFTSGGVARNIAEAVHRIFTSQESESHQVLLVSPIGNDLVANMISSDVNRLGMRTDGLLRSDELQNSKDRTGNSAVVNMHLDGMGNLMTGVADMSIVEKIGADPIIKMIDKHKPKIVAFDANLSSRTLALIVQFCYQRQIRTFFEPTSVPRSTSILPALSEILDNNHGHFASCPITFISPNQLELTHLFNEIRSSPHELTSKPHWWHVMDDLDLGERYRSDLGLLSLESDSTWPPLLRSGLPQMAVTLLPFFQHLFIKCGKNGVFVAMRLVNETAMTNGWSHEHTRPELRQLVARGKNSTLVLKHYPAIPIKREEIVNVTGAGDSFAGSLLTNVLEDDTLISRQGLDTAIENAQHAAMLSLFSTSAISSSLRSTDTSRK